MATAPSWEAQAAILGPTSALVRRIEIYNSDGVTRWSNGDYDDRLIDGSVSIDYGRAERRAFSLTLENDDFALEHSPEKFWYDKIIKIYNGVKYVDTSPVISTVVRTNLSANPNSGVNTTGYGLNAGTTGVAAGARITTANSPASATAWEVTWSTASTAVFGGAYYMMPVGTGGVTPGLAYSGRLYIRVSKAQSINLLMYFYNDAGTQIGSIAAGPVRSVTANTWNEFKVENVIAPSGATRILLAGYGNASGGVNWAIGDKVAINGVMIEQNVKIVNSFTGATLDFGNRDYSWTGTAESSTSRETITVSTPSAVPSVWETQVGEFMIDSITEAHFPYTVEVVGRDYTKKCMLSKFVNATAFAVNTKVEDAVKAIALNAGITKFIMPLTGLTFDTDYYFEADTTRWDAMSKIATSFGYELFFDAQGYLVMREFQDPISAPLAFVLETGPLGSLVTYSKTVTDTRIYNHVVVTGESSDSQTIVVSAEAFNTESSSPTNIATLGDRVYRYSSPFVTDVPQAQDLATKMLKIMSLEEFNLDFSSISLPWLETGEIVQFNDPRAFAGQPTRFLLSSLTLPLGLGAMSGNAKRVSVVG